MVIAPERLSPILRQVFWLGTPTVLCKPGLICRTPLAFPARRLAEELAKRRTKLLFAHRRTPSTCLPALRLRQGQLRHVQFFSGEHFQSHTRRTGIDHGDLDRRSFAQVNDSPFGIWPPIVNPDDGAAIIPEIGHTHQRAKGQVTMGRRQGSGMEMLSARSVPISIPGCRPGLGRETIRLICVPWFLRIDMRSETRQKEKYR
jgi:hypothetical protein